MLWWSITISSNSHADVSIKFRSQGSSAILTLLSLFCIFFPEVKQFHPKEEPLHFLLLFLFFSNALPQHCIFRSFITYLAEPHAEYFSQRTLSYAHLDTKTQACRNHNSHRKSAARWKGDWYIQVEVLHCKDSFLPLGSENVCSTSRHLWKIPSVLSKRRPNLPWKEIIVSLRNYITAKLQGGAEFFVHFESTIHPVCNGFQEGPS